MANFQKNILFTGFILSAALLTIIQLPFGVSFCAWFALVPFVLAAIGTEKTRTALFASYIISLIYWLANIYWLGFSAPAGWIVFCFFLALYWPLLVITLRYCFARGIPLWFALPVLIVGTEALQGWFFKGFAWRYLAHSQFKNLELIQIADIFGAAGVSFIVAMVNGLIADLIIEFVQRHRGTKAQRHREFSIYSVVGIVLAISIVSTAILYGRNRIVQTGDFVSPGPKIVLVQSNVAVKAGEDTIPAEVSFIEMLLESRRSLAIEPNLIIWPETMVEVVLSDNYLKLLGQDDTAKIFHNALVRHANEGVYLLVGSFAADAKVNDNNEIKLGLKYNAAFLYEPNQLTPRQNYNKIHLVPFGEYIPFKKSLPAFYKFMMALTPYDYDYTLNPGEEYTVFEMKAGEKKYHFGVMICYEDTLAKVARRYAYPKRIDWLVNISNDGWFVRQKGEKIIPSTELAQRAAISVFRAVENRIPILRSVNTGISCYIDSLGRIHNDFLAGNLPQKALDRVGVQGWFADQILIDRRITVFSRIGQRLEISCVICLIFAAFLSIYRSRIPK
ncbi:MAG: apolipoprotein N-acyltransferase [Phycisphaerae bacterium]